LELPDKQTDKMKENLHDSAYNQFHSDRRHRNAFMDFFETISIEFKAYNSK